MVIEALVPFLTQEELSRISLEESILEIVRNKYYLMGVGQKQTLLKVFCSCSQFLFSNNLPMFEYLLMEVINVDKGLLAAIKPKSQGHLLLLLKLFDDLLPDPSLTVTYVSLFKGLPPDEMKTIYSQFNLKDRYNDILPSIQNVLSQNNIFYLDNHNIQRPHSSQTILETLRNCHEWTPSIFSPLKHLLLQEQPLHPSTLSHVLTLCQQGMYLQSSA